MNQLEMKLDALVRLATAENKSEAEAIKSELRNMSVGVPVIPDPEYIVREILLELGAPDHLGGHPYTVQAILLAVQDRTYIENITCLLYPQLAVIFDTTASRAERAIRHLVEVTFNRGDYEVLNHYFGNTVSADKGKPTNGEFIARLAAVVKLRLAAYDKYK